MPYKTTSELPASVRNVLPAHAQDIFKEAYNSAYKQYADSSERRGNESQEEAAVKVAWSAVKHQYEKGENGHWRAKE